MIARFVRNWFELHDRAGQFATDLRILLHTLATIVRFRRTSKLPFTYPLRCQHCARWIRLDPHTRADGRPGYRDQAGHYSCDGTIRMPHRPMPAIR